MRVADALVEATVNVTAPFPEPLAGATVIHAAPLVAVQAQTVSLAVISIVPDPPVKSNEALTGTMEYEHGTPVWVTIKSLVAIVRRPVRVTELVAAATV